MDLKFIARSLIGIPRVDFRGLVTTLTHTSLIFASDARIEKLYADLSDICASLEFSVCDCVHVKNIASIVGQIISMSRQLW